LALASMEEVVVATAAVVIRKFRRFIRSPGQFLGLRISLMDTSRMRHKAEYFSAEGPK
jgi:hypothetical protein